MEYLVHTSGEVSKFHNKAYVVKASSEQEAQEIAKKNFEKEFDCVKIHAEAQSYTRTKRAIAACILMFVAIVIACFPYPKGWIIKSKEAFLRPEFISCLWAIVFYCIYGIRFKGIQRTVETPLDIILCVLVVILLSSLFKMLLKGPEIFGIELLSPTVFLAIACFASLLGVKIVSVGCFAFVTIIALSRMLTISEAMDFWGVIYLMCAFIGMLLYLSVEPAILEALPQIKGSFANTFKGVKKDFAEARSEAESIINKLPK